ncbi:uncharacterized protein LOC143277388 [Babylonia areolata]|uniref:uncharacterized protein LOC143277388 n=1 Tax=Babylonia areolata TaxID=304850 RepID=UPI003FD44BC0
MSLSLVVVWMTSTLTMLDVIAGDYRVELEHMTSLKIPSYTEEGEKEYRFGAGSVTSMAYDEDTQILYAVGGSTIHYVNVSNPNLLDVIGHTSDPNTTFYDVKTCGQHVLATYTRANQSGLLVARGYHHCQTAVVAVSGKAFWDGTVFVDPEAAVLIVSLSAILARETTDTEPVTVLDFRSFDGRTEELTRKGIHFPMKGRVGSLSQDLDPSDVTIDDVTQRAYVTLQVNNAVAVIDLLAKNLTRVIPLGLKDWVDLNIDLSDKDGGDFLN